MRAKGLGGAPDVALVVVGGHSSFDAAPTYLEKAAAPYLAAEIAASGLSVETFGFVDDDAGPKGFGALKERLAQIRDEWVSGRPTPTRVVIVAHSQGGPWAHAATRDVPDCPVRCFVDLDASSHGWELVPADAALGGNPVDRYAIPVSVNPPQYPTIRSEPGDRYDLEDVIFPSVRDALEVVTGAVVVGADGTVQRYDERWNARLDGTTFGLWVHYSGSAHSEPTLPPDYGGWSLSVVRDWLVERLGTP
jgi:hypothetical protein